MGNCRPSDRGQTRQECETVPVEVLEPQERGDRRDQQCPVLLLRILLRAWGVRVEGSGLACQAARPLRPTHYKAVTTTPASRYSGVQKVQARVPPTRCTGIPALNWYRLM